MLAALAQDFWNPTLGFLTRQSPGCLAHDGSLKMVAHLQLGKGVMSHLAAAQRYIVFDQGFRLREGDKGSRNIVPSDVTWLNVFSSLLQDEVNIRTGIFLLQIHVCGFL